jgi:hypothetical protein
MQAKTTECNGTVMLNLIIGGKYMDIRKIEKLI